MTNPLQKAGGYIDDRHTITDAEADGIDTGQANSCDGAGGGDYSPAATAEINGNGLATTNLRDTVIDLGSVLRRAATAHWPRIVDDTTLLDQAAQQVITTEADIYVAPPNPNFIIDIELATSAFPSLLQPVLGQSISIIRPASGVLNLTVDGGAGIICTFPGSIINQANAIMSCKCIFDGSLWRVYSSSADTIAT